MNRSDDTLSSVEVEILPQGVGTMQKVVFLAQVFMLPLWHGALPNFCIWGQQLQLHFAKGNAKQGKAFCSLRESASC